MTRKTNKAHIIRAAVESMAYQVSELIQIMALEAGKELKLLKVDGGPTNNEFLMQLQSDLIQKLIVCSRYEELSVIGAVYFGGLIIGVWNNINELIDLKKQGKTYQPKMDRNEKYR